MPKRLKPACFPLPKFANEEEEARYWGTHSVAEIWDKLPRAKPLKLSPSSSKAIRERYLRRKQTILLRLGSEQIAQAKKVARRKSIGAGRA